MQRFAVGLVVLLLALAPAAQACQIVSKEDEAQQLAQSRKQVREMAPQFARRADAIVIATVESTRDVGDLKSEAILHVDETLKGNAPPTLAVTTSFEETFLMSCNPADYFGLVGFEQGERMLVYLEGPRAIRTRRLDSEHPDPLLTIAEERAIIAADAHQPASSSIQRP